ncbi:hypothetical protein HanXRQr2_Chr04g0187431 [Helianthus annuus]|uniref:Uncharacterized protein n=1 Tax=Helianthus annuus TaxID=4232 RepID=A0A9K3JBE4_HELAN|nr:hypothetical protein HanXRQr2_Chr04g0187431 [Helianthus annuus]KAJ0933087.1 hypothetical protein HanPSC8_Chr04g0181021 [Helianthus annuus]
MMPSEYPLINSPSSISICNLRPSQFYYLPLFFPQLSLEFLSTSS